MSGLERLKLWCRTESANEDDFKELEKEIKKQGAVDKAVEELRFIHNKFCFKHKDIREYVEKRLKELKEGVWKMVVSKRTSLIGFYFDQNKDFLGLYFKSKISFANWFLVQQKNRGLELKVVCNGLEDVFTKY